jgi:phospholipid/cholesterol/gamma-HCH transport system substrate-binding protein
MRGLRWTVVKLALFTAITVAVTTWLAAIIGNFQLFGRPYRITAEFTDATGLLSGDVVKAAGVTIGRVEEIRVDDGIAVVTMSISDDVDLPASLGAEIRFRNLIGQRMIMLIEEGSDTEDLLEDGDLIPLERTEAAFDLTELFNGLRPLIRSTSPEDINIVARELTLALQGRSDETEKILSNLSEISELVVERDEQLQVLLDNLNVVTADLAAKDTQLRNTLAKMNDFLAHMQANRAALESALVNFDAAAARLKRVVAANDSDIRAELDDLQVLLDVVEDKRADLKAVVRSLPEFAIGIERVTSYGEWASQHLIDVCKDDLGTCGARGTP